MELEEEGRKIEQPREEGEGERVCGPSSPIDMPKGVKITQKFLKRKTFPQNCTFVNQYI